MTYHQHRAGKRLTATETDFDVLVQRAVMVAVDHASRTSNVDSSLDELELLIDTAGAEVIHREVQKLDSIVPATYVGSGKADEIAAYCAANDIDLVVFDCELTPAQQRNLEKIMHVDVVDRVAVILDIFAQHATTGEGMVQVELAQLKYMLPRLRGRGASLSQQGGGIGTRGPGETQLEVDRRKITRRMRKLESDLKKLEKVRSTQRKRRSIKPEKRVAIVGYTNAGKSSLLNALANSDAFVQDRLFATLAPTTRQVFVGHGDDYRPRTVLFSDTVGFVRDLPHQLIEAFRSTLEEAADADLLVHVIDASAPDIDHMYASVQEVLKEIHADHIAQVVVWNKMDLLDDDERQHVHEIASYGEYGGKNDHFFVSTHTKEGIDELRTYFLAHPALIPVR